MYEQMWSLRAYYATPMLCVVPLDRHYRSGIRGESSILALSMVKDGSCEVHMPRHIAMVMRPDGSSPCAVTFSLLFKLAF